MRAYDSVVTTLVNNDYGKLQLYQLFQNGSAGLQYQIYDWNLNQPTSSLITDGYVTAASLIVVLVATSQGGSSLQVFSLQSGSLITA